MNCQASTIIQSLRDKGPVRPFADALAHPPSSWILAPGSFPAPPRPCFQRDPQAPAVFQYVPGHKVAVIISPTRHCRLFVTVSAASIGVTGRHWVTLIGKEGAHTVQPFV